MYVTMEQSKKNFSLCKCFLYRSTAEGSVLIFSYEEAIKQCCGSGIRCNFDPWIQDPGYIFSGSRIQPISESVVNIIGLKILGRGWLKPFSVPDPRWEKIYIRSKHLESATLG
jgi:hypothetical protein